MALAVMGEDCLSHFIDGDSEFPILAQDKIYRVVAAPPSDLGMLYSHTTNKGKRNPHAHDQN